MEDPSYYEEYIFPNEGKRSRRASTGSASGGERRASTDSAASGGESSLRASVGDASASGKESAKKKQSKKKQKYQQHKKERNADRRRKQAVCEGDLEAGCIEDLYQEEPSREEIAVDSLHNDGSENASDHSGESESENTESDDETHRNIRDALKKAAKSPKKTKLILANLGISMGDIPLKRICEAKLGKTLHKLSLAKNHLESVPPQLVQSLPLLVNLDLSKCHLHQLPLNWNLPRLEILNLRKNLLRDFPDESILQGLPELKSLNLYRNQISALIIPEDMQVLPKLESLDLGNNGLEQLPDELDQLKSLKKMYINNNLLKTIPMRVCEMDNLEIIDFADNMLLEEPTLEYCQSGPSGLVRYWRGLGLESNDEDLDLLGTTPCARKAAKRMTFVLPQELSNPFTVKPSEDCLESDTISFASRDPELDGQARGLRGAVVVVGLWDEMSRKIMGVGSGFVVSRRRGLIVTASHTLMNIWCDAAHEYGRLYEFGRDYFGLPHGKVVIGVIPTKAESYSHNDQGIAVFRYFAKIVEKDPSMKRGGNCQVDACLLRITDRFENDVDGECAGCGNQPCYKLLGSNEKLQTLELLEQTTEIGENVIILGYGQLCEDDAPPDKINRFVEYIPGVVTEPTEHVQLSRTRFNPRKEIAVMCPTMGGQSGGPCVSKKTGKVIGIVSRADPRNKRKCYLSPTSEWKCLLEHAKKTGN